MEPLGNFSSGNNNYNPSIKVQSETKEKEFEPYDGCCLLFFNLILLCGSIAFIVVPSTQDVTWLLGISIPFLIFNLILFRGSFIVQPGEAVVLTFYGTYVGTVKKSGYFWCNPLMSAVVISLKSQNFNGTVIKVNDLKGNPIEIAIVIVWRVKNTAKALFDVENYNNFVLVNSESAVRHIAMMYPYDKASQNEISLRSGSEIITRELVNELHGRLDRAGIDVEEARITHLAYAAEIASAMLRRQQAEAIIVAREKIVQGAVSIVGHAIQSLKSNGIVDLKEEDKAKLVSNMLVVLCSESQVHPVVNTN